MNGYTNKDGWCPDMWKKLAAMVSASITVASCQTTLYKPIICEPGTALKEGRCQKVASKLVDAPKAKVKKPIAKGPGVSSQSPFIQVPKPRQNVYGQPI